MLSKRFKQAISDIDGGDAGALTRRQLYRIFIDIALALPKMRQQAGLTQRELASRLNTSHPTIARWESPGYTGYSLSKLVQIADSLGYEIKLSFIPKADIVQTAIVEADANWINNRVIRSHKSLTVQWQYEGVKV